MDATAGSRREELLSALQEVSEASEDLAALLTSLGAGTRSAFEQVEGGASAIDVAQSMDLANRREILNTAATRMRDCRHQVQRAFFLLALAEGSSRAEIARVWRVSRQLVSRMTGEQWAVPQGGSETELD